MEPPITSSDGAGNPPGQFARSESRATLASRATEARPDKSDELLVVALSCAVLIDEDILRRLLDSWEATEGTDNIVFRLGKQVFNRIVCKTDLAMESAYGNVAPVKRTFDDLLRQVLCRPITIQTADGDIVTPPVEAEPTLNDLFRKYTEKNLGRTVPVARSIVEASQENAAPAEEPRGVDGPSRQYTGKQKRSIPQADLDGNSSGSIQSLFAKASRTSGGFQESQHLRLLQDSMLVLGKPGTVPARVVTWTDTARNYQKFSAINWNRRAAIMPRWLCNVVATFINTCLLTVPRDAEHLKRIPLSVVLKILGIPDFRGAGTSMGPGAKHALDRFGMQNASYDAQIARVGTFQNRDREEVCRRILGGVINQEKGNVVWRHYPISPEVATRNTQDLTREVVQQRLLNIDPATGEHAGEHDDVVQEDP